jgi:hypothetical protein
MLYLAPAIIADARNRKDAVAVTVVNVLLGWTVVGWFAALVWARHPVSERRLNHVTKNSRRAIARITIDSIVTRAQNRSRLTEVARSRLVPLKVGLGGCLHDGQTSRLR